MSIPPPGEQSPGEPASDAAPSDSEHVHRRGRWLAWLLVIGIVGATLGVLQVTGGLATVAAPAPAPTADVRVVPVGEAVDVGPASITVYGVVAVSDLGEIVGPPDEGNRFIAVTATVAVTDRKTWENVDDSIRISGVPGLVDANSAQARLINSSQRANSLQPGLPADVAVIFEQPLILPAPPTVTVTLYCWQRSTTEFGDWWWQDERPCAELTVETEDRTAAAAATPSPGASQ